MEWYLFYVMCSWVILVTKFLSLYLFLWRHCDMISAYLFSKLLIGSSNISNFSLKHKLHHLEVGLYDLNCPLISHDTLGLRRFSLSVQYSIDNFVSFL